MVYIHICPCYQNILVLLSDIMSYFFAVKVFVIFKIQNFVLMQPRRYFVPVPRGHLLIWVLNPTGVWTTARKNLGPAHILNFCMKCFDAAWFIWPHRHFLVQEASYNLTFPFTIENLQLYFFSWNHLEPIRYSAEVMVPVTTNSVINK